MDTIALAFENMLNSASDSTVLANDASSSMGAVVFGVPIGGRLLVEGILLTVLFVLSRKSHKPPLEKPLTKKEIDQLCDEWVPEPLVPSITEQMKYEPPVLESAAGPHTVIDGKEVVNFTSADYLGFLGHEKLLDSATRTIEKYGVGTCSSRQFYGSTDVHIDCEARIAKFLGTPDTILYPYGLSASFSTIPAICKKGDNLVVDEGVHWGIQNGLNLSKGTVVYFRHNDMESLQSTLENVARDKRQAKNRLYVILEAVYQNSGQISPLDEIIRLREKYQFRVILDESNSIGVLGSSGRGLTEHYKVPIEKVDLVTASMGHALASEGGFCAGNGLAIFHQRLNGSGFAFSASSPPYLSSAAMTALDILEGSPDLLSKLKENLTTLHEALSDVQGLEITSDPQSPIVFLRLKSGKSFNTDLQVLQRIADRVLKECSVLIVTSKRSKVDKCMLPAGIRLLVSAAHTESDLVKVCESLKRVVPLVLTGQ